MTPEERADATVERREIRIVHREFDGEHTSGATAWRQVTTALGYGDGFTEPQIGPDEFITAMRAVQAEASEAVRLRKYQHLVERAQIRAYAAERAVQRLNEIIDKIDELHAPWHDDFCTQCGTQRCATTDLIAELRSSDSTEQESDHG